VIGADDNPEPRRLARPLPRASCAAARCSIRHLALKYPKAETIHLAMDNLSSHHRKSLTDLYGRREMAS